MRIEAFTVMDQAGLDRVEVSGLSDVVVVAGPNGVGKTRLIQGLIQYFRGPSVRADIRVEVSATSESERKAWKKSRLDTSVAAEVDALRITLQKPQRRNQYRSTVLNFDSDRSITQVKPFTFSWDIADPFQEDITWDFSYRYLRDRYDDVQHSLFKLVESQRRKIAAQAELLMAQGITKMSLDFADPLKRFKEAFHQLLAPKEFVSVDTRRQQIIYSFEGQELPMSTLSSGEREVVNIVFDFLLRNPSDCIVFFDEPELHLHPELSYKLLQTLDLLR